MRETRFALRALIATTAIVIGRVGPASADEVWGPIKSVNPETGTFYVVQDGNGVVKEVRIGPDTEFELLDGRIARRVIPETLRGLKVFVIREEGPSHYAAKVWIRPNLPPARDPLNPGVAAIRR